LTKGPAIETAGLLAVLKEKELLKRHSPTLVDRAKALCMQMTVVADAMLAMGAGGVTAMHDATEGGVIGGLYEIANASGVGMEIDEEAFIYPDEVRIVCETFGIDPVTTIAEGSLLITVRPNSSANVVNKLQLGGIQASIVGQVTDDVETRTIKRRDGSIDQLEIPSQDPFWPAFFDASSS